MVFKRLIFAALISSLMLAASYSAVALELTVHDIIYKKKELLPRKLEQLQWLPGSHLFSYVDEEQNLVITDADSQVVKRISLKQFNEMQDLKDESIPELSFIDATSFWVRIHEKILVYDIESGNYTQANSLPKDAANLVFYSPEKIAYTLGPNLFIAVNNQHTQLTDCAPLQNIVNGHVVHRSEFGINQGSFWSKSGKLLAYYRMDESMVDDYPFKDIKSFPTKYTTIKYPMTGVKSHEVKLLIYNLENAKTITLDIAGPADQYLTNVSFSADDKHIFVNILNRAQNSLATTLFETATGTMVDQLWEYQAEKYINPAFSYYFSQKRPEFPLWCSRHLGWFSLFELDINAKELRALSQGSKDISSIHGFCESEDKFFYSAFDGHYPSRHGYMYDFSRAKEIKLTAQEGIHTIKPSEDGKYVLDTFSNVKTGYQVNLLSSEGEELRTIYEAPDSLKGYKEVDRQLLTLKSADGHYDLFARLILPADFDKNSRYPAIVYVYGGPHAQIVQDTYFLGARLWEIMMAQKGYVVFSLDNRGSGNRGLQFEQESFRALGKVELLDQLKGIEFLQSRPYVDASRLGVYGWSFGGFMATSLMVKYPEIFKVGIAGGAVTDWRLYEAMYGERFMGTANDNNDGYLESSCLNFVQNLKGRFMMISGTHDDVVVPSNTELFIDKAIESGNKIDSFYYPYGKHHFDSKGEFHLHEKITTYFDENL